MQLLVPVREEGEDDIDFSLDGNWEQLCCDQVLPKSIDNVEAGDVFAMEDRRDLTKNWPGRRMFVGFDNEHAWLFNEEGRLFHRLCEAGSEDRFIHKPLAFALFKGEFDLGHFTFGVLEEELPWDAWKELIVPGARVQMSFGCPPEEVHTHPHPHPHTHTHHPHPHPTLTLTLTLTFTPTPQPSPSLSPSPSPSPPPSP